MEPYVRVFSRVPDAFRYLLLDAVLVEADLEQRKPADAEEAALIRKPARRRCGYLIYTRRTPDTTHIIRRVHGWKWLELLDLKMQVPLAGLLIPANGDERAYGLLLLDYVVNELYPELQEVDEYFVVCDALYDTVDFAYEVLHRYGGHVVAPRSGTVSKKYEWADEKGVPRCTTCNEPAVYDQKADWPSPQWRLRHNLPRAGKPCVDGSDVPIDAGRNRWKCAKAVPGCTAPATYFRQNPRLYTYLPHGGQGPKQGLRAALIAYRNVIESGFAWAEDAGFAGTKLERARWAGDDQADHSAWMTAIGRTARKLVHQNGLYQQTLDEAKRDDLLTRPTARRPAPGPCTRTQAEVLEWRAGLLVKVRPPDEWEDPTLTLAHEWLEAACLLGDDAVRQLEEHGQVFLSESDDLNR